jgi:hypothetical protein
MTTKHQHQKQLLTQLQTKLQTPLQTQKHAENQNEYYALEFTEKSPERCKVSTPSQTYAAILFLIFLIILVPCMFTGNARVYSQVLDNRILVCHLVMAPA